MPSQLLYVNNCRNTIQLKEITMLSAQQRQTYSMLKAHDNSDAPISFSQMIDSAKGIGKDSFHNKDTIFFPTPLKKLYKSARDQDAFSLVGNKYTLSPEGTKALSQLERKLNA